MQPRCQGGLQPPEAHRGLDDPLPKWLTPVASKTLLLVVGGSLTSSPVSPIGGLLGPQQTVSESKAEPGLRRVTQGTKRTKVPVLAAYILLRETDNE